jgi:acetyl-CoA synthase
MNFTQLAGSVGGGVQTPGFIGVGKLYLTSKKFISAEGGLSRLVWMPKDLKEALRPRLEQRAKSVGLDGFVDRIADETVVQTIDELLVFLKEKNHPALTMPSLL